MGVVCAIACIQVVSGAPATRPTTETPNPANYYARWPKGLPSSEDFFPIAVWLQDPRNAAKYKDLGINLFVGLWNGPTETQLAALDKAGMRVICDQNDVGLTSAHDGVIVGWMHQDEPDNAQSRGAGKGYGPPVTPEAVQEGYRKMRKADPSRPVLLNLGQGVAWDGWYGRGVRTNKPEDYARYAEGCDIVSFDIYPAVTSDKDVAGKLWLVPFGVDRLRTWTGDKKIVWNCIETTRISNENRKPTPAQVRAEVWMSLIHGSQGLIYFAHQFKPKFIEAGILADPEMADAVRRLNRQITALARVLNSPDAKDIASVHTTSPSVSIDVLTKRQGGSIYVFAVAMREGTTKATFSVPRLRGGSAVAVVDEDRTILANDGTWADDFQGWGVHVYRITE